MAVQPRERMLDALLDLCGRSSARTRPELIATALRCALQLTDSAGSMAVAGQGRRLQRLALRRDGSEPESLELASGESELTRLLYRHGHPLLVDASQAMRVRCAT